VPLPDRPPPGTGTPSDPAGSTPERTAAAEDLLADLPTALDLFAGALFARPDAPFAAAAHGGAAPS
jgi:hypothetical protein